MLTSDHRQLVNSSEKPSLLNMYVLDLLLVLLDDYYLRSGLLLHRLDYLAPLANNSGHEIARDHHLVDVSGSLADLTHGLHVFICNDSLDKIDIAFNY